MNPRPRFRVTCAGRPRTGTIQKPALEEEPYQTLFPTTPFSLRRAMPGVPIDDATWLESYDALPTIVMVRRRPS